MAGCGYVCPICEGKGIIEEGKECDYCNTSKQSEVGEDQSKSEVIDDDNSTKF